MIGLRLSCRFGFSFFCLFEITPDAITTTVDLVDENLEFLFSQCDFIFNTLEDTLENSPPLLRYSFERILENSEDKFGEEGQDVVPICFFLRFVCPSLLQPKNLGFTEGCTLNLDLLFYRVTQSQFSISCYSFKTSSIYCKRNCNTRKQKQHINLSSSRQINSRIYFEQF